MTSIAFHNAYIESDGLKNIRTDNGGNTQTDNSHAANYLDEFYLPSEPVDKDMVE